MQRMSTLSDSWINIKMAPTRSKVTVGNTDDTKASKNGESECRRVQKTRPASKDIFKPGDLEDLKKAYEAYQSKYFSSALTHYKKCMGIGKNKILPVNTSSPPKIKLKQWEVIIHYLTSKCLLESKQFSDLLEAKNILIALEKLVGREYPMIYHALGLFYVKTFCFTNAERVYNMATSILNDPEPPTTYYVPGPDVLIKESTMDTLAKSLLALKDTFSGWHRPNGMCFMENCEAIHPNHVAGRDIYFASPAFTGMIKIICNNINPCTICFHTACWKLKKEQFWPEKMSDKDLLGRECLTPNCVKDKGTSIICKMEVYGDDGQLITTIERPPEKEVPRSPTPVKGAIKKQKVKAVQPKIPRPKPPPPQAKVVPAPKPPNTKLLNEEEEMAMLLSRLERTRLNNFYISKHNDWRADHDFYGNSEVLATHNDTPVEPDLSGLTKELANNKSWLYSCLYDYIDNNAPMKTDVLMKKWTELIGMIPDGATILYDSHHASVSEFLLDSLKFIMMEEYFCTPISMAETYTRVTNNTITTLQCLLNRTCDMGDDDEDIFKDVMAYVNDDMIETRSNDLGDSKSSSSSTSGGSGSLENIKNHDENQQQMSTNNHDVKEKKCASPPPIKSPSPVPSPPPPLPPPAKKEAEEFICEPENISEMKTNSTPLNRIKVNGKISDIVNLKGKSSNPAVKPINGILPKKENSADKVEIEKLQLALKSSQKNLDKMKERLATKASNLLRAHLQTEYTSKSSTIKSCLEMCKMSQSVVKEIQTGLMTAMKLNLPINEEEWLNPIGELELSQEILDKAYAVRVEAINNGLRNQIMTDEQLPALTLPPMPKQNALSLLQLAFSMCEQHCQRTVDILRNELTTIMANQYAHPPIYPPQMRYPPPPLSPSMPYYHPPVSAPQYFPPIPQMRAPMRQEATNALTRNNVTPANGYPVMSTTNAQIVIEERSESPISEQAVSKVSSHTPSIVSVDERVRMPAKKSLDTLMAVLRTRNQGAMEYDLLMSVGDVRKKHDNSLTGLPINRIILEVEHALYTRQKAQVINVFNSAQQNHRPNAPGKSTGAAIASTSRENNHAVSGVSMENYEQKEYIPKDNPWTPVTYLMWEKEVEENECIICMEAMDRSETGSVYSLKCQHTFHRKCIRDWFSHNHSCPTCRVHSTMDDEFPPLPQ